MKVKRKIIQIDEERCDGCGQCVPACAEGAIQIINGKAKVTLALVKGKRKYDKRAAIKKRDQKRDFDRERNEG